MTNQAVLEAVLRSGVVLPSPGPVLARLQEVVNRDDCGPREITAVVEKDPGLVGALIRVATSPVFRAARVPKTAFEAVTMLGRTRTVAIATSEALRANANGVDEHVVTHMWGAAARCAELCWALSRYSRLKAIGEVAYLSGLLHDVGVMVLLRRYPEHQPKFRDRTATDDQLALQLDQLLGVEHAKVSGFVLRNWKLPAPVVEAVEFHHSADARFSSNTPAGIAALMAAARLVRDRDEEAWAPWDELSQRIIGLDKDGILSLAPTLDGD